MRCVILGASAAAISAARAIRGINNTTEITMVAEDARVYSRCLLPRVISGERSIDQISFIDANFFSFMGISFIGGQKVVDLRPDIKELRLAGGEAVPYDKLLVATGASPVLPPVPGLDRGRQVLKLRNLKDAIAIKQMVQSCPGMPVVVMGAGLVGMEAAEALIALGARVIVVELADRILPLQLDQIAAGRYAELFAERGIEIITRQGVARVELDDKRNVQSVVLSDGRVLPCGLVIVAAGVRPNTDFLSRTGIALGRGITVDERQRTSLEDIFAAGDVCESRELFTDKISPTPIWPAAVLQGRVAGLNMAGVSAKLPGTFAYRNSMRLLGLSTLSYGWPESPDDSYVTITDWDGETYRKVIYKDNRVYGAIIQGDVTGAGVLGAVVAGKIKVEAESDCLLQPHYGYFFRQADDGSFMF